jgi:hypothetical protein
MLNLDLHCPQVTSTVSAPLYIFPYFFV